MTDQEQAGIAALIRHMNEAWRTGDYAALETILHENVVIAAPDAFEDRVIGREACINTYRDFAARARVTHYEEEQPWIGVWGPTASASYGWLIAWEDDEGAHSASGRDVVALNKGEQGWRVVGRLMLEQARI